MKYLLVILFSGSSLQTMIQPIFTFSPQTNIKEWNIVNDGVMGGISNSTISLSEDGHGKFAGHVSLANYGGFASVQLNKSTTLSEEIKFVVLRVKGDGKNYEFRLKGDNRQSESYVSQFSTSGQWEEIKLKISEFYPQFRGRKLDTPNFNYKKIEQLSFLIANKKEEDFELLIDWIGLE